MPTQDNNCDMQKVKLGDLVDIRPGYPFRGRIETAMDGDGYVVQPRNVSPEQLIFSNSVDHPMEKALFQGRKQPDYLQKDDILFLAKGHRNFAVVVNELPDKAVITPFFFKLQVKAQSAALLLPAFLAWQLNHVKAQTYFSRGGQGTAVRSITRSQLENYPVSLPALEKQQLMVDLVITAQQEKHTLQQLIENRSHQIKGIGQQLLNDQIV